MKPPPCVLTIAGSDSGAGAGVQADARTIHALGGYACTAITAVTAQNTRGVAAWRAVPPALIAAQIAAVLGDFPVAAIKTGLLPGPAAVRSVAAALARHPKIPLVVDPVIGSTSGTRFLTAAGLRALRQELLPRATLVTPNWPEASALTGRKIETFADAETAGRALAEIFACAVLVKGGHGPGKTCRDCLVLPSGKARWFSAPRVATLNTHGTGCVLSAAIAAALARGATPRPGSSVAEQVTLNHSVTIRHEGLRGMGTDRLVRAVASAQVFLQRELRRGRARRWGRGAGPAFAG